MYIVLLADSQCASDRPSYQMYILTLSWLKTPKYIVFLYKSSWQQATITHCSPSIHNVFCTWADFEHLVDSPYTVFTKRTLCLALNCKMKFIFFHILWTLRILININKISDNEESIKQWYHNITFVSPCINTVKYVQYILGINICTEQNKIKWKGRASNIKSRAQRHTTPM